jgi:tRNA modification GTPase
MAAPARTPVTSVQVALLTPSGRGALAVVGIAGSGACELADRRFRPRGGPPLARRPDRSIAVGTWHAAADSLGEELVVVRHAAEQPEVHCHGGLAAAEAVLVSLAAVGAIRVTWPAWLAATGAGEIEVEAREALALAAGPRAAEILSRQLAGALAGELARLAGLPAGPARRETADRLLCSARIGLRLTEPWRVVVAGPVNAGKSSLVNALAGHARSIVSPEPGTTRDLVTTRLVLGGWEVELADTAGQRPLEEATPTEAAGIALAAEARGLADLVVRVVPAGEPPPPPADRELVVITKADLAPAPPEAPPGAIVTSAVTGRGIDALEDRLVAALVPEERDDPELLAGAVPFTSRQVEVIRTRR